MTLLKDKFKYITCLGNFPVLEKKQFKMQKTLKTASGQCKSHELPKKFNFVSF